jgi:tetratricopeptide (TPR) repeat protein
VELQTAYNLMEAAQQALGRGDIEGALAASGKAGAMFPDNAEMAFWPAVSLALGGRLEEALPLFRKAFRLQPSWVETTRRLPAVGLLQDDPSLLARIVAEA